MAEDPENTLVIELGDGSVTVALLPDTAPAHVARVRHLARAGAYDGVVFHRVIEGFMAQTGDVEHGQTDGDGAPRRAGTGGSDLPDLAAEFSRLPFDRGMLGMARTQDPDSANSQFFITLSDAHHLNGQYTLFGRVTGGMAHVDALPRGEPPANPARMRRVRMAADG